MRTLINPCSDKVTIKIPDKKRIFSEERTGERTLDRTMSRAEYNLMSRSRLVGTTSFNAMTQN